MIMKEVFACMIITTLCLYLAFRLQHKINNFFRINIVLNEGNAVFWMAGIFPFIYIFPYEVNLWFPVIMMYWYCCTNHSEAKKEQIVEKV
ncbi:hypothetical protein [Candidatus Uabimicrobium sp. HlEnr_7]|uniref:hypothetical protein n=1 Tax=Candidatus Uabimicrobium helgolandensis TaxID=3095367 RepID=UPI00355930DC